MAVEHLAGRSVRAAEVGQRSSWRSSPLLLLERRTALVGLVATAVAFGPARMAFGMLLPSMRDTFALSGSKAGLIASGAFAAFAVALIGASLMTRVFGAKLPVLIGAFLALTGSGLVAVANSASVMATGVVVASASAGMCWTPFNAVAGRLVRERRRDRILSVVSTGTTLGIALMALAALLLALTGASWRFVWIATALGGAAAGALAWLLLPPSDRLVPRPPSGAPDLAGRDMARRVAKRDAWPLYAAAFAFGAVSATFATFAVDHIVGAIGGAGRGDRGTTLTLGGLVFLAYGVGGVVGFLTDAIEGRTGLSGAMALCFTASAAGAAAFALAPGSWPLVMIGSGVFGASVMVFSVLLSVAGLRLFPALPVLGFTVAVLAVSVGSAAGPALAGVVADEMGTTTVLLCIAGVSVVAAPCVARWRKPGRSER